VGGAFAGIEVLMQLQKAYQNDVSIAGRSNSFKVTHPGFRWTMFLLFTYSKAFGLVYIEIQSISFKLTALEINRYLLKSKRFSRQSLLTFNVSL